MKEEEILTEQENIRQVYNTKKTDIIAKKRKGHHQVPQRENKKTSTRNVIIITFKLLIWIGHIHARFNYFSQYIENIIVW